MERSSAHKYLKRKCMTHIFILSLFLPRGGHAKGEESSCEVTGNGTCVQRMTGEIKGEFFKEKRPFTVYYKPPNADQEVAALFSFVLSYHCQATREYVCDHEIINNTFSVSIKPGVSCKEGNFTFFIEGGQPVVCQKTVPDHTTNQRERKEDASKKGPEWLYSRFSLDKTSNIVTVSVMAVISGCAALAASFIIIIHRHESKEFVKNHFGDYIPLIKKTKRKEHNISISSKYKAATAEHAEI